jgi:cytochrome c oxidase subunit 2
MRRWTSIVAAISLAVIGAGCAGATGDSALAARGRQLFLAQGCHGCHNVGAVGSRDVGADLSRIGARRSRSELERWLRDPAAQKPAAHMPRIAMTDPDVQALAAYLASLR